MCFRRFFLKCSWLCFVNYRLSRSAAFSRGTLCWVTIQEHWNGSSGESDSNWGEHSPMEWLFPTSVKTKLRERHILLKLVNAQEAEKQKGEGNTLLFFSWGITGLLQTAEVVSAVLKSECALKATGDLDRKEPTIALRSLMIHSYWMLKQNYFHLKFNAFLETTRRTALRNFC